MLAGGSKQIAWAFFDRIVISKFYKIFTGINNTENNVKHIQKKTSQTSKTSKIPDRHCLLEKHKEKIITVLYTVPKLLMIAVKGISNPGNLRFLNFPLNLT